MPRQAQLTTLNLFGPKGSFFLGVNLAILAVADARTIQVTTAVDGRQP
jgi:hypothetical protein